MISVQTLGGSTIGLEPSPPTFEEQLQEKNVIGTSDILQQNELLPILAKKTQQSPYKKKLPEHAKLKKIQPKFKWMESYMHD